MQIDHIAFSTGSKNNVNRLTDKLKANTFKIISEPKITGDGYYESCIINIEGNQMEITV